MSEPIRFLRTKLEWAIHLNHEHTRRPSPSVMEMMMYPQAMATVMEEHRNLHLKFYTGHEHNYATGEIKPGKTK